MDLVGIRTMEFCRRWGLVPARRSLALPARLRAGQYLSDQPHRLRARTRALSRHRPGAAAEGKPAAARALPAEHVRSDPARIRGFAKNRRRCATARGLSRSRRPPITVTAVGRECRDRRARRNCRALHRRLRRRAQPGARDARHRDARQPGADLHHERDLPLPAPALAARQGQGLPPHLHRPGRHLVDHRRDQRPRPMALLHHRRIASSANTRPRRSRRRSAAPSAAISSSRF